MTCQELLDRVPEESSGTRAHEAVCAPCRQECDAYRRDVELLVDGFLSAAGEPDLTAGMPLIDPPAPRARQFLPIAIAAAALLGIFELILIPALRRPRESSIGAAPGRVQDKPDPEAQRRREQVRRRLTLKEIPRGKVSAVANEIGLVVISIGKDDDVKEGDEFSISRKGALVAKIQIDRADRTWSAGKVILKNADPWVADDVRTFVPVPEAERKAIFDYLFSFRPATPKDGAAVRALLADLDNDSAEEREKAARAIGDLGAPARAALKELDLSGLGEEAKARLKDVQSLWGRFDDILGGPGLERDVEFLASLDDPRAYERLQRMLGDVRPFSIDGFPTRAGDWAEKVQAGWSQAKDRLRWNSETDRYEERK